jgi:hypothetical protein
LKQKRPLEQWPLILLLCSKVEKKEMKGLLVKTTPPVVVLVLVLRQV